MPRRAIFHSLLWFSLLVCTNFVAQAKPQLSQVDRIRLAEAFRLADQLGDRVWPNWSKAPFALLLLTPDYEFLIRHPQPSPDFAKLGYDNRLKSDVYYRKRTFRPHLLATFPAIRGSIVSTIVIGQAENTSAKSSTPWVLTMLHEHFHQLQDSQPNFYADVEALNLSRGDQTGMWMLNYAFPYHRRDAQDQFALLSRLLSATLQSPRGARTRTLHQYLRARAEFQSMLAPDDYNYISFQLWKEGIARYSEYRIASLAATDYRASKEFVALEDYTSFAESAKKMHEQILEQLKSQQLGKSKREVVYAFGAAEGLLLDRFNPAWRSRYFVEKFDLGKFY